jgi:hypothetical protein
VNHAVSFQGKLLGVFQKEQGLGDTLAGMKLLRCESCCVVAGEDAARLSEGAESGRQAGRQAQLV